MNNDISFKQVLIQRLQRLDANYARHRAALLTAIQCEDGGDGIPPGTGKGSLPDLGETPPPPLAFFASGVRNQMDLVKAAIVTFGDAEFTKNDLRAKVKEMQPDISDNVLKNMSSFLWQLHKKEGFIAQKMKGQGHRQSIYAKL